MPPHVFSIEEGLLRYAYFPRSEERIHFREYHSVELPSDSFTEGPLGGSLREPAHFQKALGALLEKVSLKVSEASLVLPDGWLRVSFAEAGELPRSPGEREEVLRWKLKQQVPFRVNELRLAAAEVPPLEVQEEPRRLLLGFGIRQLLDQFEDAFEAHGIRIGQLSSQSMALLTALAGTFAGVELAGLAKVDEESYSLLIVTRGEPLLHRFKSFQSALPPDAIERMVLRDLKLTKTFLAEKMGGAVLHRMVLVSSGDDESAWSEWLERVFEVPVRLLIKEWPLLTGEIPGVAANKIAPLLGAACQEVA